MVYKLYLNKATENICQNTFLYPFVTTSDFILFNNLPFNTLKVTFFKRSVFIPIPKKGNAKECSNYHTLPSSHTLVI